MTETSRAPISRRSTAALAIAIGAPLLAAAPAAADPSTPAGGHDVAQNDHAEVPAVTGGTQGEPASGSAGAAGTRTQEAPAAAETNGDGHAANPAAASTNGGAEAAKPAAAEASEGAHAPKPAAAATDGSAQQVKPVAAEANGGAHAATRASAAAHSGGHGGTPVGTDVTNVSVKMHGEHGEARRATAHVKAGADLEAALRAEAREAAREEVRARIGHALGVRTRFTLPTAVLSSKTSVRKAPHESELSNGMLVHLLHAAWRTGGTASVTELLAALFGSETSGQSASPHREASETQNTGHRNVTTGAMGRRTTGAVPGPGNVATENRSGAVAESTAATAVAVAPTSGVVSGSTAGTSTPPSAAPESSGAPGVTSPGGGTRPASGGPSPGAVGEGGMAPAGSREVSAQRGQLPFTGVDVPLLVVLGAAALFAGALTRRLSGAGAG